MMSHIIYVIKKDIFFIASEHLQHFPVLYYILVDSKVYNN